MWYYVFAPSGLLSWARYQTWYYSGHSTKCNTLIRQLTTMSLICLHSTKCCAIAWPWVVKVESCFWVRRGFLGPNPTSGFVVDFHGRMLLTVPINPVSVHAEFERSPGKEWYNPSRTSSVSRGDSLEQSCLGVGNSKTRRNLRQQLPIIYCSMIRLHTVARERKRDREGDRKGKRERER